MEAMTPGRWRCECCGEPHSLQFTACWRCGTDRKDIAEALQGLAPEETAAPPGEPLREETRAAPPPPLPPEPPRQPTREVWFEVGVVMGLYLLPLYYGCVADVVWPREPPAFGSMEDSVSGLIWDLPTCALILYLMRRSGDPWSAFGLKRPRWLSDAGAGAILYLFSFGLSNLLLWLTAALAEGVLGPLSEWQARPFRPSGVVEGALAILSLSVSSSTEELVMRAYLIPRLERLFRSGVWSVLLTTILFAAYHAYQGRYGILNTLIMGLAFGAVFCLTRRFWPLAFAHIWWNLVTLL